MRERELTLAGEGAELPATLTFPENGVRGGLVPLHPASDGSRRQFLFEHLTDTVVPRGLAVLRFDRRPAPTDGDVPFTAQADDALQALAALRVQPEVGSAPLGLWAWSQGAWPAALAAARSAEIAFLILLAACGVSPAQQMRYGTAEQLRRHGYGDDDSLRELAELRAAREEALRDPGRRDESQAVIDRYADRSWFPLAYVPRTLEPASAWPDMDFDPDPILASVHCPVLLFYGEEDEWTPIEPSIAAWQRAAAAAGNDELTVVRLARADHAPTHGGIHDRGAIVPAYTQALTEWIDRRLADR
jgi:pimeloyl-ACP methyl ester carboxylesterase